MGNDLSPEDIALILAEAKATNVSSDEKDALVLGCDQVLALGDDLLHKAQTMEDARRRLLLLSVKHINSIVRFVEPKWRNSLEPCGDSTYAYACLISPFYWSPFITRWGRKF